ncbi:MAG: type III pantothenate kinase [bacterium]|nr:type III pantothenate kinase [bacterium]
MILVIDIGNSRITVGVYQGSQLQRYFHTRTEPDKTEEDYHAWLKDEFRQGDMPSDQSAIHNPQSTIRNPQSAIRKAVISSVVPSLTPVFVQVIKDCPGIEAGVVNPSLDIGLKLCYDAPSQLGADRLANVIAARALYGCPAIVIDLGTAVTFDCLSQKGEYLGGIIIPGPGLSSAALSDKTALLELVDISKPEAIIGKNTADCIRSGLFYGTIAQIEGIVRRLKSEIGGEPKVIVTGGWASLFASELEGNPEINSFLTLEGLRIIGERGQ